MFLAYTIFLDPLPVWSRSWYWPLLLLPLCLAVAIVYKGVRCGQVSRIPREALGLFITIVALMMVTALALAGLAAVMD
jgi:hypothetical protein